VRRKNFRDAAAEKTGIIHHQDLDCHKHSIRLRGQPKSPATPESNTPGGVTLEHARYIENQGDATVTGNGGARHAWRTLQHLAQRLDYHFFLTYQLIDDKTDSLSTHRQDH